MAVKAFTQGTFNGQGRIYTATLDTGDETDVLKFVGGESDVQFSAHGTIAGSTVTAQVTLDNSNYVTAESQAGTALALTTIGVAKVVKTVGIGMKWAISGGTASGIVVNVYVPHKVRP